MNIPDYISPVVGYRVWQWDNAGIRSLNGERWHPGKPLAAGCRIVSRHAEVVRGIHDTPQADCSCGVYATKSFDHLHSTGYDLRGICGAVWLWGTVVEHKFGWRAQFAYPKSFCIASDTLPFTLVAIQSRLETLIPYSTDIFVASPAGNLSLWTRGSGYEQAGLDYLVEVRKQGFERRWRILKRGDRVAVIGRGIAIVRMIYEGQVCAVLSNQTVLEIGRKQIVWDEANMRWEANYSGVSRTDRAG